MVDEDRKDDSNELNDLMSSLDPRKFNETLLNDGWLNKQSKSRLIQVVKSLATRLDMLSTARMKQSEISQIPYEPAEVRREPTMVTHEISVPAADRKGKESGEALWELLLLPKEEGHRPLQISVMGDFTIGRTKGGKAMDLDLSSLGGVELGVSGQHAAIRVTPTGLYLVDLSSTNGTYFQYERVELGNPVKLTEGAVIGFGKLVFLVSKIEKLG